MDVVQLISGVGSAAALASAYAYFANVKRYIAALDVEVRGATASPPRRWRAQAGTAFSFGWRQVFRSHFSLGGAVLAALVVGIYSQRASVQNGVSPSFVDEVSTKRPAAKEWWPDQEHFRGGPIDVNRTIPARPEGGAGLVVSTAFSVPPPELTSAEQKQLAALVAAECGAEDVSFLSNIGDTYTARVTFAPQDSRIFSPQGRALCITERAERFVRKHRSSGELGSPPRVFEYRVPVPRVTPDSPGD